MYCYLCELTNCVLIQSYSSQRCILWLFSWASFRPLVAYIILKKFTWKACNQITHQYVCSLRIFQNLCFQIYIFLQFHSAASIALKSSYQKQESTQTSILNSNSWFIHKDMKLFLVTVKKWPVLYISSHLSLSNPQEAKSESLLGLNVKPHLCL